jgi:hypothetical protein
MEVTLKGQGSFASICSFVDQLARLKRLSKVKNLTLSASDSPSEYPMTATLVIYFALQGKDAPSPQEGRVVRGSPDPAPRGAVRRPATTQLPQEGRRG